MIIGFDASRSFINKRTGTENYSYQLLTHLAKIDLRNQYRVFLRPGLQTTGPFSKWPSNFSFITIPYPKLWTQIGLAQRTFNDHLDLLFVPSHTLPLIRKPGLKTILTVHDLGAEYLPQTHQLKQRLYLKLMTDYQLKSATHLIAVSQATREDLIKNINIPPQKISVIYEGYNNQLFKPLKNDILVNILKQYDLEPLKYFLFVGTIQPRKNLARLIKAYAEWLRGDGKRDALSETCQPRLVLAGSKGWLSEEIYTLPQKLGITDHVRFLGFVPDEKLPALYIGALAFLYPSLYEGFGLPILEAMACGTPVLTANVSSMPEVGGKAALYVDPTNVGQITKAISQLASNPLLRTGLRNKGLVRVKSFSWEKCARQTMNLFLTLKV